MASNRPPANGTLSSLRSSKLLVFFSRPLILASLFDALLPPSWLWGYTWVLLATFLGWSLFNFHLVSTSINTRHNYVYDLLPDAGLMGARSASTPLPKGLKFSADLSPLLEDPARYRRLVGRLLYLNLLVPHANLIGRQLCISFAISKVLLLKAFSTLMPTLCILRPTLMPTGLLALTPAALSQAIASSLGPLLSLGRLKNRILFPGLRLR